jgi:hypothetical protein
MNNQYADALDSLMFARMHDNYWAQEIRSAQREANINHTQQWIVDEVFQPTPDSARRSTFIEELVDDEGFVSLIGDLLDDVQAGVNPTETIRRRVASWALRVAEEEDERGEA